MITVTAYMQAAEGKQVELKKILEGLLEPTWNERGCLQYDLYSDQKDPNSFVIFEQWEDDKAYEAHTKNAHILKFLEIRDHYLAYNMSAPRWDLIGKK